LVNSYKIISIFNNLSNDSIAIDRGQGYGYIWAIIGLLSGAHAIWNLTPVNKEEGDLGRTKDANKR
jgi:hypothetical protein